MSHQKSPWHASCKGKLKKGGEIKMRKRQPMKRRRSKKLFKRTAGKKSINRRVTVKRGGIRL